MPELPSGRLFWKFLLFFFLAQMTTMVAIGLSIWADHRERPAHGVRPPHSATSPAPPEWQAQSFPPAPPPRPNKLPLIHLLIGSLVSLCFSALLAAYVARPIRRLRQALQAAAAGRLNSGVSVAMGQRRDELADLGADFDRMAYHLAQLMEGQQRLLHDVSHELRSPLARLNAIIGLARQQPEALDDCLARLECEAQRMDRLLSELLRLSRLEAGMVDRTEETVELGELLADVVADAAPQIEQSACTVDLACESPAQVRADPEMLHRVFDNLLRNALSYAASGAWVGIRLTRKQDEAVIRIEDAGPGVLSSEVERIFTPFYRAAPGRGHDGHGLGLAIARQIVEHYRGHLEASNRTQGGLCLTVRLPCLKASD